MLTPEKDSFLPNMLRTPSYTEAVRSLGTAAYTLYCTPEHALLHTDIARIVETEPELPLHPASVSETYNQTTDVVLRFANEGSGNTATSAELIRLSSALIQFTDYVPSLHRSKISYDPIANLHKAIVENAQDRPLTLPSQLEIALKETDGDMFDALWNMFLASRLYARWLDSQIFTDMPNFTVDEKLALMKQWNDSMYAFKSRDKHPAQDASGDTYYAWTHALAKYSFTQTPAHPSIASKMAVHLFHNGTRLMHNLVHKVANAQSVKSDHSIAANFGNAVGQACVDSTTY